MLTWYVSYVPKQRVIFTLNLIEFFFIKAVALNQGINIIVEMFSEAKSAADVKDKGY